MNSLQYSFVFFVLVPLSLGLCHDISFSICWMSKEDALEKQNGNIWLNDTSLKSIRKEGFVTSLTVSPGVENKLTLQYGGSVWQWTLTFTPRTKGTTVTGHRRPQRHPTNATKALLDVLSPTEVFACENGTIFFHQDENFFLAVGHTLGLPVKLVSRSPTMLLVSWLKNHPDLKIHSHTVTLYHVELGSYNTLGMDSTTSNHYHFSALDSCSPYVACVQVADTQSFTCLSTITDPDIPKDFEINSWNTSSISLSWECPINRKYSLFLLTAFYLNGTDHIMEELTFWQKDSFTFTLSDLQPCSRVKFGLQTVCQAGADTRYSKMIFNDGNSVLSNIKALHQTAFGPDNYTLNWQVRNISSISMFRVYHKGEPQGTTLHRNYTVQGLLPCHNYKAKVEALCGDGVLMNVKTVTAHTGPGGVSDLRYRSNDSTALWTPSIPQQPVLAFIYELSMEKGPIIQSSRLTSTELRLPGLEEGKPYILDVWEECDGQWESKSSRLHFEGSNLSSVLHLRAAGSIHNQELHSDLEKTGLALIVPWLLPEGLQDKSETRAKVGEIFKDKMRELLKDFTKPVHIELVTFEPQDEADKTEILFLTFDASKTENVLLPAEDQLNYISSLNITHITVTDGVIHWNGPDLCISSLCPNNSLCMNTLGSFSCVCQHGYHDVSSITEPHAASHPVCKEKGLFSQCVNKGMTGGIGKPYLLSHIGGQVDVKLNDGRCTVNESRELYYFHTTRRQSECGTERQVNKSHIVFQNTLTVTLAKEQTITRRDLKLIWRCIYPRHYVRNAQASVDLEWLSSASLVEFNSSLQLGLSMTLYMDESYTYSYMGAISLELDDTLFFEVALQTNGSFGSDVLLQVESCWATESPDPQDTVHGVLLQDSCPADNMFHWLSVNGLSQRSRFSTQMFTMPRGLPLYFHCLANICGHDEDCTKNCSSLQRTKRSESLEDKGGKQAAIVSAGPLIVNTRLKPSRPSYWEEHMTVISIVAGSIGFLVVMILLVSAAKVIMTYLQLVMK